MSTTTVNVQEEKKGAEVDVQKLGNQAVIKLVCSRTPGQVLRVLHALDECKVDLLQSNVTTVGDISVHFVTVQVSCRELPPYSLMVQNLTCVICLPETRKNPVSFLPYVLGLDNNNLCY
jgi:glycine cleavage system regulatory protein